ncbi:hypothetical protein RJ640_022031 [Escallonia rubra]|uniref:Uncharacterized protein n=1 Tax=Escallonia rubra TaxID=112253 RepID=A0AA88U6G1_9ASTE|nr:hypothetical protein RJ640_022031 [Escallonia rubra]
MTFNLHNCTVEQPRATINRVHIFFHFVAIVTLLYYRISHVFQAEEYVPVFAWWLMTSSELILTFIWILTQAFRWRPVSRTVNPENLPGELELPGVDVFICTADPEKEPVIDVMNTVLSAMALDYPSNKLAVYLSDDGGAASTLYAVKEASSFAKSWIPFCRKYGIKTRTPELYFSSFGDDDRLLWSDEFMAEEETIKSTYELFKKNVEKAGVKDSAVHDRPPCIELRVSSIISNNPYILVLDCDMYCNDPTSAQQAMCFHLEPQVSSSLAYVQFPQIFYNVSKNDIYDGQARAAFKTKYQGMDGVSGTVCAGTGYYMKKKALYVSPNQEGYEVLHELQKTFGMSSTLIASLKGNNADNVNGGEVLSATVLQEASILASCTFEENTKWGNEIGYSYESLLESTFTGYRLHTNGWKSVYLYPKRSCFLGCTTIDMKDALVQLIKWSSGCFKIGLSRFSPLTYGMPRMSVLQSLCYGSLTFFPLLSVSCVIYGTVPQLCFLNGIALYPKVSDPWFAVFVIVYLSSFGQHLYEVFSSGGSFTTCWNEQRIWMIRTVTACLFGCLDVLLKWLGITKASFRLTNKAIDREKLKKYEKGIFDFQGAKMFMIPLTLLVVLNMICFIGGATRVVHNRNIEEMFGQFFLSSFIFVLSYPVLKGMIPGKGK